jgi:tripartite-type tricarboxylate transporter receptor subunit TctC
MTQDRTLMRRRLLACAPLAIASAWLTSVRAQAPADKPVRLICGHPPGGQADVIARIISPRLGELLEQTIVNEYRAGAAGTIAATLVARSPPDGRTLLACSSGNLALARVMTADLAYDPLRDFTLIARIALVPSVLAVGSWLPVTSVSELIDYAKAHPGKLAAGSSGNGSTSGFSLEMLKATSGADILQVPYGGLAPAVQGLLSRQVDLVFVDYALVAPHAKAGSVRLLATPASRRLAALPELPTLREQGLPAFAIDAWVGIVAPAGLPPDVFARLSNALRGVAQTREVRRRLQETGFEPLDDTPAQFREAVVDDVARFSAVARRLGINPAGEKSQRS